MSSDCTSPISPRAGSGARHFGPALAPARARGRGGRNPADQRDGSLLPDPRGGRAEHEMLEAYTTLGFLAAHPEARCSSLSPASSTGIQAAGQDGDHPRRPLASGRVMLGIGAAGTRRSRRGLGFVFPPLTERFEAGGGLEICLQMWSEPEDPVRRQALQARAAR